MRPPLVTGLLLVFALAGLTACEGAEPDQQAAVAEAPSSQPTPKAVPQALDLVVTDVLTPTKVYQREQSNLPVTFPGRDEQFPSPLTDPPGGTVMTYRPYEGFLAAGRELVGEPAGWAGETVFFWTRTGEWRRLDLTELGLPESEHLGDDTYGVGRLSPDGLYWSAHTRAGFVVVDLRTGSVRSKRLGAGHSVHYLRWLDATRLQAVGHGRRDRHEVWEYDVTNGELQPLVWPARWSVWPDPSGSAVLFSAGKDGVRRTTWPMTGGDPTRDDLPFRYLVSGWPQYGTASYLLAAWKDTDYDLLAVDRSTDVPLRALTATDGLHIGYRWWVDERVVLTVSQNLYAWDPASGDLRHLARAPSYPSGLTQSQRRMLYWHADLAVDVVSLG